MKKYLVFLSVLAVVLFTVTAYAATQVELFGDIRIRAEKNDNLTDFQNTGGTRTLLGYVGGEPVYNCSTPECYDDNSWYNQRVRLGAKATISPKTFGVIEIETGTDSHDTWTWEGINSKHSGIGFRQAYIAHTFGDNLATLHVGHMLLSLGNKLFFDHTKYGDDAALLLVPAGPGNLMALMIKLNEGNTGLNDDVEAYVVGYNAPINSINIGGEVTYLRWHKQFGFDNGAHLANIGVRADANLSGAMVKGDIEYQWGKFGSDASGFSPFGNLSSMDDIKVRAFAAMIGAEIPAGPVSVRANAAYGSGDKESSSDKYEGFINFLGDDQHFTYVYDYKTLTAAGAKDTGLNNTWYLNAGVTAKPMTDLTMTGDVYFLRAAKKLTDSEDSKAIGTEVDAKVSYQLDAGLVYWVEGGYLFAGDMYKNYTGGEDVDNPWSVRHGIQLTF